MAVDVITVVVAVIAVLSLALNVYQAHLNRRRSRREQQAELTAEAHKLYENANSPAEWQVRVTVRNTGGARAYEPAVWIADDSGRELTRRFGGRGHLEPGEPHQLGADLPTRPTGALRVMIGWGDSRGDQTRDTTIRL
jgi:hypothetical protein